MNYFELLNRVLKTSNGQKYADAAISYTTAPANPFITPLFEQDKKEDTVEINGKSIFSKATKEEYEKINYDKILADENDFIKPNDENTKLSPLEFVIKVFLSIDKIRELADKNKEDGLTIEEVKEFVENLAGQDGNIDDISLDDFEKVIKDNNIDLDAILNEQEDAPQTEEVAQQTEETPVQEDNTAVDNAYYVPDTNTSYDNSAIEDYTPSYDTSNYTGAVSSNPIGTELAALKAEKEVRINTLHEKEAALEAAKKGENANIKAKKDEFDKAREEYETAITEDIGAKEFADDILKNNEAIEKNEADLEENAKNLEAKENEISESTKALGSLKGELSSLQSSLSNLPAISGREEDRERDNAITKQKADLQGKINRYKAQIIKAESDLSDLNKQQAKLRLDKLTLEGEKKQLAIEKENLDKKVQEFCTAETKKKLDAFNQAKINLENTKAEEIKKAEDEVKLAQDSIKEIDEKIAQKQAEEAKIKEEVQNYITVADDGTSEIKPGLFKGALAGQEALVTRLCKKYNVSPALVASIIGLESGYGTSNLAQHNNFMGYRAAGDCGQNEKGFGYFSTPEKGLDAAIKNLANYTRFSDVDAVDFAHINEIGRHYCEGGTWAGKIKDVYNTHVRDYMLA